jgi:hypothetical protein
LKSIETSDRYIIKLIEMGYLGIIWLNSVLAQTKFKKEDIRKNMKTRQKSEQMDTYKTG